MYRAAKGRTGALATVAVRTTGVYAAGARNGMAGDAALDVDNDALSCNSVSCARLTVLVGEHPLPCDHRVPPSNLYLPYPESNGTFIIIAYRPFHEIEVGVSWV